MEYRRGYKRLEGYRYNAGLVFTWMDINFREFKDFSKTIYMVAINPRGGICDGWFGPLYRRKPFKCSKLPSKYRIDSSHNSGNLSYSFKVWIKEINILKKRKKVIFDCLNSLFSRCDKFIYLLKPKKKADIGINNRLYQ